MRQWSKLLRNPASTLHGFDSFLGLPHDWTLEGHERGYFSTEGQVPEIDDPRVRFFVGWFEETLPQYEWPEHEVLVDPSSRSARRSRTSRCLSPGR